MAIISSVEYYSSCPSCGATNNGKKKCEYCGNSLIKKTTQKSTDYDLYAGNGFGSDFYSNQYQGIDSEFSSYPIIKGKNCGVDPFMILFSLIFGGCFTFVPLIICITFIATGIMEPWVILMLSVFWIIGIGSFVPLIIKTDARAKCKKGKVVTGVVKGYENSLVSINNRPVQNVCVLIDEFTDPKILVVSTGVTNRPYPLETTIQLKNYKDYYLITTGKKA